MKLIKSQQNHFIIETSFTELSIGIAARDANKAIDYTQDLKNIRKQEKNLLSSITNIEPENIIFLNQVHGDSIIVLDKKPDKDLIYAGDADCLITNLPGICPVIRTADCVPVMAYDPNKKILGAAHSGWRSTELEISRKMIIMMNNKFNSDINDIIIYILPSIGPDTYEVNMDVASRFPGFYYTKDENIFLDLWSIIESSLIKTGIPKKNIFNNRLCNLKERAIFFSHRGGDIGRNLNFGYIKK